MWFLALFAGAALAVDLLVHAATLIGMDPLDWIHPQWLAVTLFWGMFAAVALPANWVEENKMRGRLGLLLPELSSPSWLKILMALVCVYALLTPFFIHWPTQHGGEAVHLANGTFALDPGHGRPLEPLTESQYHAFHAAEARTLSGILLIFYVPISFNLLRLAKSRTVRGGRSE